MNRFAANCTAFLLGLTTITVAASGGGFDRAIGRLLPRAVKLYGVGAGLQAGYGTGVIVSADGLVLTVFSLLIDARRIRAVVSDGTAYDADVVSYDLSQHLALLRLKPTDDYREGTRTSEEETVGPFPYFDLTQEVALVPGDWVVAAGNAFKVADGAEPVSLAHGIFSARTRLDARRRLKDFPYHGEILVIDAITSNPGAPGSALANLDGEFVGMIGRVVTSNLTHTHFNYAVPRDVLSAFVEQALSPGSDLLRLAGSVALRKTAGAEDRKPAVDIGVRMSRFGYRKVLPFVERVRNPSPAMRAGIRKDDLILQINGRKVADVSAYEDRMRFIRRDEAIDLVVRRGRNIVSIRIEPEPQ